MDPKSKRKAMIGIGSGLGLEIVSYLPAFGGEMFSFLALILFVVGTLLFIWGCTHYVLSKGLPDWLGYLGLFSVVGLIVIFLLPSRRGATHEKVA